jgi:hypothetical protein
MLVFYIGANLCKQCGFSAGDKLDVLWDEETKKGVMLKDENGKSLTILDTSGGRGVLTFTWRKGMPNPNSDSGPLEIEDLEYFSDDEELHFTFPDGCTF